MLKTILILSATVVLATFAVQCDHSGRKMNNNEVITVQNAFRVKCVAEDSGSWRTEIVGCVTPDGTIIDAGDKKKVGDKAYDCVKTPGGVSLKQSMHTASTNVKATGCRAKDGSVKKIGQEFVEGNFVRKCAPNGMGDIVGCHAKEVTGTIPLNDSRTVNGMIYKCEKNGANYGFKAQSVQQ
uniref:Abnormal cell migration protein 18-like fibronectin type I domain-containing protein n=1 Tax=Caenorhabditis japonica TaxID=281687 RepID=A0A8R1DG83_CAEJA